jgi:acetylornithine deacetylase/succinyl-diaminopimelate desuccinylase-like protein
VRFIADRSHEWGLSAQIFSENHNGLETANVIIKKNSTKPPEYQSLRQFLLCSRLDTQDPGDYGRWVRTGANPYNMSVDGEWIYGLGTLETKADFVCKWLALKDAKLDEKQSNDCVVVGSFGLSSAAGAIRLLRKKIITPKVALVGGPTGLGLAHKGPGFAKVEITLPFSDEELRLQDEHNRAEVSSSQSKIFQRQDMTRISLEFLDNPILKLIDYINKLPAGVLLLSVDGGASSEAEPDQAFLEIDLSRVVQSSVTEKLIKIGEALKKLSFELKGIRDPDCVPGYSTITLGKIRTVSDGVQLTGTCRLIPTRGRDLYEEWLERLRQECAAAGANLRILDYKPPFVAGGDSPFLSYLKQVSSKSGLETKLVAAFGSCEANVFQRMGIESVVFGPGERVHNEPISQQKVRRHELELAQNFYRQVLEGYRL